MNTTFNPMFGSKRQYLCINIISVSVFQLGELFHYCFVEGVPLVIVLGNVIYILDHHFRNFIFIL